MKHKRKCTPVYGGSVVHYSSGNMVVLRLSSAVPLQKGQLLDVYTTPLMYKRCRVLEVPNAICTSTTTIDIFGYCSANHIVYDNIILKPSGKGKPYEA
jgi:hypothetical protein